MVNKNTNHDSVLEHRLCELISCDIVRFVELPLSGLISVIEVSLNRITSEEESVYVAYDYFRRNDEDEGELYASDWEVVKTYVEEEYPEAPWVKIGLDKEIRDPQTGAMIGSILDWEDGLTVDNFVSKYGKWYKQDNAQLRDQIVEQMSAL